MTNVGANGEIALEGALRAWRIRVEGLLAHWRDPRGGFHEQEALKLAHAIVEGIRLRRAVESEEGVETGPRWSELVDRIYELESEGMRRLEGSTPTEASEPLVHAFEKIGRAHV